MMNEIIDQFYFQDSKISTEVTLDFLNTNRSPKENVSQTDDVKLRQQKCAKLIDRKLTRVRYTI